MRKVASQVASPATVKAVVSPASLKSPQPGAFNAVSPASKYERLESNIGEGTYGKVHKHRDLKTGRIVAIKKAKASAADRDVGGISFTALREIKLMKAVRHPNVMDCLDVFADGGVVHLVMEFMDGDMKKVIEDKGLTLMEPHIKCLASQILKGLGALHARWFVHRDVAPANVLLSFRTGVARLGDFGMCRTIGHALDRPLTPMCTTLWYRAPELLYGAKFYGPSVDIWSAGCVIAEMFNRQALFQGRGEFDMMTKIFEKRGTPTEDVWRDVSALPTFVEFSHHPEVPMAEVVSSASTGSQDFLAGLLRLDPKLRPSVAEALASACLATEWPAPCEPHELPFASGASSIVAP
jgi:cyclin-dependent kinase 7